jgi:hypothetical protein
LPLEGSHADAHRFFSLPPGRDIAEDGGNAQYLSLYAPDPHHGKLQRNARPVLPHCRYGKQLSVVLGDPCGHHPTEAVPVLLAQAFRDNQLQGLSHDLRGGIAKDGFGPTIPEPNDALPVGKDDGLLGVVDNVLA